MLTSVVLCDSHDHDLFSTMRRATEPPSVLPFDSKIRITDHHHDDEKPDLVQLDPERLLIG